MANHSSTEKSIRKIAKKTAVNKNRRSKVRTYLKRVVTAVDSGVSRVDATSILVDAQSEIMRAVSRGLIKKNTASRKISRLAKRVKSLESGNVAEVPKASPKKKTAKTIKPENVSSENN